MLNQTIPNELKEQKSNQEDFSNKAFEIYKKTAGTRRDSKMGR